MTRELDEECDCADFPDVTLSFDGDLMHYRSPGDRNYAASQGTVRVSKIALAPRCWAMRSSALSCFASSRQTSVCVEGAPDTYRFYVTVGTDEQAYEHHRAWAKQVVQAMGRK